MAALVAAKPRPHPKAFGALWAAEGAGGGHIGAVGGHIGADGGHIGVGLAIITANVGRHLGSGLAAGGHVVVQLSNGGHVRSTLATGRHWTA